MAETIGFIGLGIMGRPMARNLVKAGFPLVVHSRSRGPVDELVAEAAGAVTAATNPREVAARAKTVVTMLPDSPDVRDVVFGADGLREAMGEGHLLIDMSTIAPATAIEVLAALAERGAHALDAPVSGGDKGAIAGTLSIMVGGAAADFERARPLFEAMGKNITLVGEANGAGQTCKVANQIVVALTIEAVAEALVFASKAGADPARVRQALMGGFAGSKVLEIHGERMIQRTFDPGFRIELHQKDLNLALDGARALNMSLPNAASCQELFNACAARGGSAWDHSALVRALELMANHEIGARGGISEVLD